MWSVKKLGKWKFILILSEYAKLWTESVELAASVNESSEIEWTNEKKTFAKMLIRCKFIYWKLIKNGVKIPGDFNVYHCKCCPDTYFQWNVIWMQMQFPNQIFKWFQCFKLYISNAMTLLGLYWWPPVKYFFFFVHVDEKLIPNINEKFISIRFDSIRLNRFWVEWWTISFLWN